MSFIDRRSFVAGAGLILLARPAHAARTVTDSAGRTVTLPDRIDGLVRDRARLLPRDAGSGG